MRLRADKRVKLFCRLFTTIALFSCATFPHLSYCSSTPNHNHNSQRQSVMGENSSHFLNTNQYFKNINNLRENEDNCRKFEPVKPTSAPFLEISTINTSKERVHLEILSNRDYHEETIILNATSLVVYIKCKAPYPIDFEYNGHLSNRHAKATSIKRLGNACFEIGVEVAADSSNTGNYSCFSVQKQQVRSSYYIYFTPMFNKFLINWGRNITIRPGPRDKLVRIPCPTSNPKFVMKLEKQVTNSSTNETSWVDYSNSSNIFEGYDPKFGWSFKLAEFEGIKQVQFYRCTSTYNDLDRNVIQVFPFVAYSNNNNGYEDASLLSADDQDTDSDGAHSIYHNHHHHPHNHNHQEIITSTSSRRVAAYRDLIASCSQESGELRSFDCSTWIECRMRQCRIHDMECETRSSCSKSADHCPNGIIQCLRVAVEPVTLIYYHGLNKSKNFYTDQDHVPLKDILSLSVKKVKMGVTTSAGDPNQIQNGSKSPTHLTNSDDNDNYTDSKVTFVCTGSSFMFCIHFQWTIKMSDGHFIVIPTENVTNNKWNRTSAFISSEVEIQVPRGFQEIQCTAPVWNHISAQSVSLRRNEVFRQITSIENSTTNHKSSGVQINRLALTDLFSCWLLVCAASLLLPTY